MMFACCSASRMVLGIVRWEVLSVADNAVAVIPGTAARDLECLEHELAQRQALQRPEPIELADRLFRAWWHRRTMRGTNIVELPKVNP